MFNGEDTRKNFTDHLYAALDQVGIHTFIDDELPRGHDISSALLKSIEESRISIVVFSTNYASSRWCLDELVKIIECKNSLGQLVLPIFYDVDPFDVRNQTRCFGEAFLIHEKHYGDEMEKVEVRRAALFEAGTISGWDSKNVANGHEAELIRKHPVGIESRVADINSLLSIGSDDVRMIGIYGLGGIGKTTIATAVYNRIFCQFKGSCFPENVREFAEQSNGLFQLLEQLLFQLLGTKNLKIDGVYRGINLMKEGLHSKKVLIVLDDVDHLSQLNTLAGNRDWFGPGSRMIITTRHKHLLKGLKVDERYMAKEFNHEESLQLFSLHAFGETNTLENYVDLANGLVSYAGGLPLALEVLGSYLFGRPLKKHRTSFDALNDEKLKDIFLDIACFFIGMDKDCAITILNTCDLCAEVGISVLIDRCLLRINERNMLTMHDLLQDMGREIIRQESPKELGKRSRLWFHKNVCNVLQNNKGTEALEGVILTGLPMVKKIQWSNKTFAGMHNLRLLQINHMARYLPDSICKLKSVERLNLVGCAKLELPEQLGDMESLTELLADGIAIKQLPLSIGRLKNLRSLSLKGCHRLFITESCISFISSCFFRRKNPDLRVCTLSEEDFPVNFGSIMDFGKDPVVHTISNGNNDGMEEPHYFEGARI
ncbi:unnamed protein product [Camellia sinensis]